MCVCACKIERAREITVHCHRIKKAVQAKTDQLSSYQALKRHVHPAFRSTSIVVNNLGLEVILLTIKNTPKTTQSRGQCRHVNRGRGRQWSSCRPASCHLRCYSKARQDNQSDNVPVLPLSPCCHPCLLGVPACAKIALVGHEDRLEGEGRWLMGGANHLSGCVRLFFPHPVAFLTFLLTIWNSCYNILPVKLIKLYDGWRN